MHKLLTALSSATQNSQKSFKTFLLRKLDFTTAVKATSLLVAGFIAAPMLVVGAQAQGVGAEFGQVINPGVLLTAIRDADRNPVAEPSVSLSAVTAAFDCEESTGVFGTTDQRIYVDNPNSADSWSLTITALYGSEAVWSDGTNSFSFNDPSDDGCQTGQLTLNPDAGTVLADYQGEDLTGISKGSQASFDDVGSSVVTLLTADNTSDEVWRGYLTGVEVSQTIPAETPAGEYTLDLVLDISSS